jgi:UDP-glucose 4-epimerase
MDLKADGKGDVKARVLKGASTIVCGRYGKYDGVARPVIPLFVDQLCVNQPLTVTDPRMTRFMMTLDDAVDLVLYAFEHGRNGDIFVQKAPAATIEVLAKAICDLRDPSTRSKLSAHDMRLYEALLSREEMACAEDRVYFRVPPDLRDLNYAKFVESETVSLRQRITPHNTHHLSLPG